MGRVRSSWMFFETLLGLATLLGALAGCGGKTASVAPKTLTVAPSVLSLEQGGISGLSVTDNNGVTVAANTITWLASNPSAVTVSSSGAVCAGTWDSLTSPTLCTPGPAVAVQLTASAGGATSSPVKVFVHQHIERLVASPLGTPVPCDKTSTPLMGLSAASTTAAAGFADYQVLAFNQGTDITSTIGPINWSATNSTVVSLSTAAATGLLFNQVRATAKTPGQTQFFASAGNTTSPSLTFITCPVESISLVTAAGGNSLTLTKGSTAQTITATVLDSAGLELTTPPLIWSSTNPTVASVSTAGVIAGSQTGGTGVTASCIPTTCNVGFPPPSVAPPVYPSAGISVSVTNAASTSTAYVASSGCWDRTAGPVLGCVSSIIQVPQSSNAPGTPITLPHIPTSMLISPSGTNIYVGSCVPKTPTGLPVCNGIAVVVAGSGAVTTNDSVTGDVVGVSLSGTKAVVSDTSTTPNQVFLYDQPTNTGTQLILATTDHARSAIFSPDGFQVYITTFQCTASPCQPSNEVPSAVYVFDAVNGLRRSSAAVGVTDVALHPSGAFAYMAQAANAITVLDTCNNLIAKDTSSTPQILATPGTPQFIRALPDGTHFIALNGPNATGLEIITATTAGVGCPPQPPPPAQPPLLPLTSNNMVGSLIDLNQGPLSATQFLLSTDGSAAYVVPQNFSSVFAYNVLTGGRSGIALVGAQPPTTGGLTSDGAVLYVGSTDGLLHVLNTSTLIDQQQIVLTSGSTSPPTNMCSIATATQPCNPDFVVVKP